MRHAVTFVHWIYQRLMIGCYVIVFFSKLLDGDACVLREAVNSMVHLSGGACEVEWSCISEF